MYVHTYITTHVISILAQTQDLLHKEALNTYMHVHTCMYIQIFTHAYWHRHIFCSHTYVSTHIICILTPINHTNTYSGQDLLHKKALNAYMHVHTNIHTCILTQTQILDKSYYIRKLSTGKGNIKLLNSGYRP
jgi:hypothetical protein